MTKTAAEYPTIRIADIFIPEDRLRRYDPDWASTLKDMIFTTELLHPITIWMDGDVPKLVAGLHRIRAFDMEGETEIPHKVSKAKTYEDARVGEIIENIGRKGLTALDKCRNYHELKVIHEAKHPETKKGVAGGKARQGSATDILSFAKNAAEQSGFSAKTIERYVAIWDKLSADSRKRLFGTKLEDHQSELNNLSKEDKPTQKRILDMLLADEPEVNTVGDAIRAIKGGKPENYVEKQFRAFNNQIEDWDQAKFNIAMTSANPKKVDTWLKRDLANPDAPINRAVGGMGAKQFDAFMNQHADKAKAWLTKEGKK